MTVNLLTQAIRDSDKNMIIVDGFPRNDENYSCWFNHLKDSENEFDFGILFYCLLFYLISYL